MKTKTWITLSVSLAFVMLSIMSGTLWWIRNYSFAGTPADTAKVVGSVLVLVGTLFTAMVTFVGLLLKHSMDQRNAVLREEAEARLKVEASVEAMRLFASENPTPAQKAGALFALVNLQQLDFALRLLDPLWKKGEIDTSGAVWVIEQGLGANSQGTVHAAAEILRENAESLPDEKGAAYLPGMIVEQWPNDLPPDARTSLLLALLETQLSRDLDYWEIGYVGSTIYSLKCVRDEDRRTLVRDGATLALHELLAAITDVPYEEIAGSKGPISIAALREEVKTAVDDAFKNTTHEFHAIAKRLKSWVREGRVAHAQKGDDSI